MVTETEAKNHHLTVQEKINVEGGFIDFGAQFGSFWGFNCGLVNTLISGVSTEEPLTIAAKMVVFTVPSIALGLLAGGGAGILASRIYLVGK